MSAVATNRTTPDLENLYLAKNPPEASPFSTSLEVLGVHEDTNSALIPEIEYCFDWFAAIVRESEAHRPMKNFPICFYPEYWPTTNEASAVLEALTGSPIHDVLHMLTDTRSYWANPFRARTEKELRELEAQEAELDFHSKQSKAWRRTHEYREALKRGNAMHVDPAMLEVLKVWYAVFCTVVDAHAQGEYSDAQLLAKLIQLRTKLAEQIPEVELMMQGYKP